MPVTLRIDPRWTACLAASLALHAGFLAWVDLSGSGTSATPSTLHVLLESSEQTASETPPVPATQLSSYRSRDLFARPAAPRSDPAPVGKVAPRAPASDAKANVETRPTRSETPARQRKRAEPATADKPRSDSRKSPELAELKPAPAVPATGKRAPRESVVGGAQVAASRSANPREPMQAEQGESTADAAPAKSGVLLALLHQAIEKRKHYPGLARRQGREGTTTVRFRLSPSGELDALSIDRSSGFRALDTAALSAVSGVAPFAPARAFLSEATRFKVNVTFRLN